MAQYQDSGLSEEEMIKKAQRLGLIPYIPVVRWGREHISGENQEYVCVCVWRLSIQTFAFACHKGPSRV